MNNNIKNRLFDLIDDKYQKFTAALLPNVDPNHILGVRLPELRNIAKEIARGDWRAYLEQPANQYFEEIMIHGMVIGYIKAEIDEILVYIAQFVPLIQNWSVCDSFVTGLKVVKNNQEKVWEFIQPYLNAEHEYEVRFGIVMMLQYFIDDQYIDDVLIRIDRVKHEAYYVKMAAAWAISISFIKMPDHTWQYLSHNTLDTFTYNKALQKITESLRVDEETKQRIRSMKRKSSTRI